MKIASTKTKTKTKLTAQDVYKVIKKSARANGFKVWGIAMWACSARNVEISASNVDMTASLLHKKRFRIKFYFSVRQGQLHAEMDFSAPGLEIMWKPARGEVLRDRVRALAGYGTPKKTIDAALKFLDGIVA